jgi:hypothetical protein
MGDRDAAVAALCADLGHGEHPAELVRRKVAIATPFERRQNLDLKSDFAFSMTQSRATHGGGGFAAIGVPPHGEGVLRR